MKVLSLFDGISCGRVALERAGIPVETYYASEIDKYAMSVAQAMYPDTIQIGDVCKIDFTQYIGKVDMIIGGSPCQDLSIAKQNRQGLQGERSRLFWEYIKALTIIKPKYFLLENVASMKNEDRDAITAVLRGIYPETECIMINSALVSAQQRKRYYWTNWHVEQPQDKGILLKDILEDSADSVGAAMRTREDENGRFKRLEVNGQEKSNALTSVQTDSMVCEPVRLGELPGLGKGQANRIYSVRGKSVCLNANGGGGGAKTGLYAVSLLSEREIDYMFRKEGRVEYGYVQNADNDKAKCITANLSKGVPYNCMFERTTGTAENVYSVRNGIITIKDKNIPIKLADGDYIVRKLTPRECARLQTYPERCFDVASISNTQWYKAFGNGWTVDVIAHIFKQIPTEN